MYFSSSFCLLSPWRPPGQYGVNSCPMVASSGFRSSPGHATSSDAMSIEEAALPVERGGAKLFFLGGGYGLE